MGTGCESAAQRTKEASPAADTAALLGEVPAGHHLRATGVFTSLSGFVFLAQLPVPEILQLIPAPLQNGKTNGRVRLRCCDDTFGGLK